MAYDDHRPVGSAPEYLQEDYVSLQLSVVVVLPLFCAALLYLLGCDGHAECETSASYVAGLNGVFRCLSCTNKDKMLPDKVGNTHGSSCL